MKTHEILILSLGCIITVFGLLSYYEVKLKLNTFFKWLKDEAFLWGKIVKRLLIVAGCVLGYIMIDANFFGGNYTVNFPVREVIDTIYTEYGCKR